MQRKGTGFLCCSQQRQPGFWGRWGSSRELAKWAVLTHPLKDSYLPRVSLFEYHLSDWDQAADLWLTHRTLLPILDLVISNFSLFILGLNTPKHTRCHYLGIMGRLSHLSFGMELQSTEVWQQTLLKYVVRISPDIHPLLPSHGPVLGDDILQWEVTVHSYPSF